MLRETMSAYKVKKQDMQINTKSNLKFINNCNKQDKMSFTNQQSQGNVRSQEELNDVIGKALKKVGGKKENDLCKYLPSERGGYIHHFTLRKMKHEQPCELSDMIKKFIVHSDSPGRVSPKQRAPRGSRKKRDIITLTRSDVERLLDISRKVGDKEMVAKLSPKRSLTTLKRDLVKSIRAGSVDHELWEKYHDAHTSLLQPDSPQFS